MRVNITVYVSEGGYTYSHEGQVNREATFEAEIEGLKSIPWGAVLGGLVESGLAEFEAKQGQKLAQEVLEGLELSTPSMRDDMDDPVLET